LIPDVTNPGTLDREKIKVGPIEIDQSFNTPQQQLPSFTVINNLVRDLITSSVTGSILERA